LGQLSNHAWKNRGGGINPETGELRLNCQRLGNMFWLVVEPYPSEKSEFVSWDDEIPNIWKNNPNVPNHQPVLDAYNSFQEVLMELWKSYKLYGSLEKWPKKNMNPQKSEVTKSALKYAENFSRKKR